MHDGLPQFWTCVKCGSPTADEPWCRHCQRGHKDEYAQWGRKNAASVLARFGVPPAYRDCTLENFETSTKDRRRALQAVKSWPDHEEPGLFLSGSPGTGKTHLAVASLFEEYVRGYRGSFISVQELLLECRDFFRQERSDGLGSLLKERCGCDGVLLLDDLGTENPTAFTRETVGQIIDRAYREWRPLIITSNYDFDGLIGRLDERTVDRLIELCFPVKFAGTSFRRAKAIQRMEVRNLPLPEVLQ